MVSYAAREIEITLSLSGLRVSATIVKAGWLERGKGRPWSP